MGEVVAGEDVEDLQQHDAAGGRRRRGDDVVSAIAAEQRLAVFDLVGGEVGGGDQSAALLDGRGELRGHGADVEGGGIGGDARQGARQFGLDEALARLVEVAVALEDAAGVREARRGSSRLAMLCASSSERM